MWRARLMAASLAAVATLAAGQGCQAQDRLKVAVGGRGIGETFITEVGYKAGLFDSTISCSTSSTPTAAARPSRR
jgi:hypothetical protein